MVNITLNQLIDLAKTAEKNNPLDWGEFLVNEDTVYKTFASSVFLAYSNMDPQHKDVLMLAGLINLNVKMFLLTLQNKELLSTIDRLQKEIK